jgi:hypothetical protein
VAAAIHADRNRIRCCVNTRRADEHAVQPFEAEPQGCGPLVLAKDVRGLLQLQPRLTRPSLLEQHRDVLQGFLGASLSLHNRATGPVNVASSARVAPVEKQHPRPEVNGVFVLTEKIAIQPIDQEVVHAAVLPGARGISRIGVVFRIGHL